MQEFFYKYLEDETYCVMGYDGDEENVAVPEVYGGKPVTIAAAEKEKSENGRATGIHMQVPFR